MTRAPLAAALLALAACATSTTPDAPAGDAGPATDAPMADGSGRADGGRDAGLPPRDASGGPCTGGEVIACGTTCGSIGRQLCTAGTFDECVAPTEDCNGADDDCDGSVDESITRSCATMCGTPGIETCESGVWSACSGAAGSAETCNGMDDDCDGAVDEDTRVYVESSSYVVLNGAHPSCDATVRYGPACNAAIHRHCAADTCTSSGFGPVENSGDTATITCVAGTVRNTTYTVLSSHHGSCTAAEVMGPNCNAAIHRYCASEGFASGFGPVENSGDVAVVTCVPSEIAEGRSTTYTALSMHHSPCNAGGERMGPNCNAAIHRWCRAQGFTSGFGPVENSGDTAAVACVR